MIGGGALNHGLEKVRAQKCGTSVCSGCAWFVTGGASLIGKFHAQVLSP